MKLAFMWIASLIITSIASYTYGYSVAPQTRVVFNIPGAVAADDAMVVPIPDPFTNRQQALLNVAYETADRDGIKPPQLLQGILLQESRAGDLPSYKVAGPVGNRYYGVGQIKLGAAKDVLRHYPEMWLSYGFQTRTDDEVMARLIEDDRFNIAVASKYLLLLRKSGFRSPKALAVAYNKGPGGAAGVEVASNPYATAVSAHMRAVSHGKHVYHVQPGDSLSKIAMALGVSMDSIYYANPDAFIDGDVDVLMAGVDLKIPESRS